MSLGLTVAMFKVVLLTCILMVASESHCGKDMQPHTGHCRENPHCQCAQTCLDERFCLSMAHGPALSEMYFLLVEQEWKMATKISIFHPFLTQGKVAEDEIPECNKPLSPATSLLWSTQ